MEKQFIEWKSWDLCGDMDLMFTHCVVVQPFGPYAKGELLHAVNFNYEDGLISVYDREGEELWRGKLELAIKEI